jgi:DNA-binding beta-propeller fold protein YncE
MSLRDKYTVAALVAILLVGVDSGLRLRLSAQQSANGASNDVPVFEVDPSWPKELPNDWIIGLTTGIYVDSRDHIWVTNNPLGLAKTEIGSTTNPPEADCCVPAPPVLEFDRAGTLVNSWGPPEGLVAPKIAHGIFVDHTDHVWIGQTGGFHLMKFTRDGKLVMTIGDPKATATGGSNDTTRLGGPAGLFVDPKTNELYVSDGYINSRVIVFDATTGAYKRHWGAYGEPPTDVKLPPYNPDAPKPDRQFRNAHHLLLSKDGLVYVADRGNDRIQVFRSNGQFVMEKAVRPRTLRDGSAFTIGLSVDPQQQYLYLGDGNNNKIWILRRKDLEVVGSFGRAGRQVGQFTRIHNLAVDSQGNIYTTEAADGRRIQKFALRKGGGK